MRPWLGNGLVTGGGAQWQIHRKLITPAFHFKILDTFQEVFSEKAQMLADELTNLADGQFFDFYPLMTHCALDIISETAMGVKINAMKDADSEYVKAIYIVADIVLHRWFRPWLHPNLLFKLSPSGREQQRNIRIVHEFAEKVIAERRERIEKFGKEEMSLDDVLLGKKKRLAFLDLLLQANMERNLLTTQEIREEVDTFMFAGHDTTTASTSWTLFQLGNYPDIQEKVHQELDSIFHGEERPVEPNDIVKMQYLDRVIKETLRFHCVVPFLLRRLTEDIYLDGKLVPAGIQVSIHMYNVHMDPEQYTEPLQFDPDRFLPEVSAKRNPYAYIPFSAGPRNCIGQKFALRNTKTLLATVLRKYKVKSLLKHHEAKYKVDVILKPQNGMKLAFEPRTL
ncbi:hypothetical protein WA026_015700 [Henosepilachna vigintioctopunctata]|uniref:Cytochrome P450 n=1 Tax=Henosepilachna vigintioctopunctata TaxID=420089 RepID=A0AAW1V0A4_9CUCU